MNVRRRSGDMGAVGTSPIKNAITKRVNGLTQAVKIPNTITTPHPQGPATVRNTVTKPGRG